MSTTSCSRGDVVLLPIPFTDLSSSRVRPAVVVGLGTFPGNLFVVLVTSQLTNADLILADWSGVGLNVRAESRAKSARSSNVWFVEWSEGFQPGTKRSWILDCGAGCVSDFCQTISDTQPSETCANFRDAYFGPTCRSPFIYGVFAKVRPVFPKGGSRSSKPS